MVTSGWLLRGRIQAAYSKVHFLMKLKRTVCPTLSGSVSWHWKWNLNFRWTEIPLRNSSKRSSAFNCLMKLLRKLTFSEKILKDIGEGSDFKSLVKLHCFLNLESWSQSFLNFAFRFGHQSRWKVLSEKFSLENSLWEVPVNSKLQLRLVREFDTNSTSYGGC